MDIASFIGIVAGAACIFLGVITSGGSLMGIVDIPSIFVTFGGSYASLFLLAPINEVLGIFGNMSRAFKTYDYGEKTLVPNMVALAEMLAVKVFLPLKRDLTTLTIRSSRKGSVSLSTAPTDR